MSSRATDSGRRAGSIPVFIEAGSRRVFASALDWPGWARSAKSEELALEALADYLPRYARIVDRVRLEPPDGDLVVVERHPGVAKNANFGSLGEIASSEREPLRADIGLHLAKLLAASWVAFEETVAAAPEHLRKGPRGGGRDTDQIVAHVTGAEVMYARKMGVQRDKSAGSVADETARLREHIVGALQAPDELNTPEKGWPPRYAARRMAWHVLDHLWEIEDKSGPG